jgi:hypothetical protein
MKFATLTLIAATLAAGSASAASSKVTDVDYLKANRCKGLATSITGVVDAASLDSFIRSQGASRQAYVVDRGAEEFSRARREAKSQDRKERLTAELTGPCQAYLSGASSVAKQ